LPRALALFSLVSLCAASMLLGSPLAVARPSTARSAVVTVTAGKPSEYGFKLSAKSVAHGSVTFKVSNAGILPHDFKLCSTPGNTSANACSGKVTKLISPGGSATLTVTIPKAGTYEYLCAVSGHAAAGMKGVLKVT
jgi:uncharacterized cupredoxin-like copper-binding protein